MPFQQIIMHALHYQLDVDVHLLFAFDIDPHLPVPKFMYKLAFLRRFSLMGTTSCAVEAATSFWGKIWVFLKNFVKYLRYMQVKLNKFASNI